MTRSDLSLPGQVPLPRRQQPHRPGVKHISLALQGGGSHGAFTWGVMHRLISEPRLYIDGISGTSAGAMNGVVFAGGLIDGWRVDNDPSFMLVDYMTRIFAPTQLNPLNMNPLRDALDDLVDFKALRARPDVKLFVTASNVRTCKSRVFRTSELTADTLLASACMPLTFKAIEIDGEAYWDGGYLGNPAIYPLINECASSDVVIVQINPMNRPDIPVTARDILNRINEMTFNASLVREMFGIATVSSLIESGKLDDERYMTVRFHQIGDEAELAKYGALSKINTERPFLKHLHDLGYATADAWIAEHFDQLGWESTVDVLDKYV